MAKKKTKRHSASKYPWDDWFHKLKRVGKMLRLMKGYDFNCAPHGMAQQVRNAAADRGVHVSIEIEGTTLSVQRA